MHRYEFLLAVRRLWRRRAQSALVLLTFSVAISLSLLGWSLFHTIFLKNASYDPRGEFYQAGLMGPGSNGRFVGASREMVDTWRQEQTVFSDFAPAGLYRSAYVGTENGTERLFSANVSSEALRMAGARPLMGRLFHIDEEKIGCAPVVLISERAWRNRFNGDPNILGRVLKVDGIAAEVVGVMPADFRFPDEQELWQPMGFNSNERNAQSPGAQDVVVRLKPGVTKERATADLRLISDRMGSRNLAAQYKYEPSVLPLRDNYLLPEMRHSAIILFVLAMVFVLIGCTNAANLVIIDFLGRSGEHAASLALGVPRAAAIRGLVYQMLILSSVSATIGLVVLQLAAPPVHAAMARVITPYWLFYEPQWHHLGAAALLAVMSVLIAVVAPVGYLLLADPEKIMQAGAGSTRGTGRGVWRRALVIGQVALLTVLAVAAGLLVRTSHAVGEGRWGYDARKIFATKISIREADFPTPELRLAASRRLLDEIEKLPGVTAAALMGNPIGFSPDPQIWYARTADGVAEGRSEGAAVWSMVTPHIFGIVEAPFVEGEPFSRDERATPPPSAGPPPPPPKVIVNQALAWKLWPGQAALGRTLFVRFNNPKQPPIQTVISGVVRDFQAAGPKVPNNDFIYAAVNPGTEYAGFFYARGSVTAPSIEQIRQGTRRADVRIGLGQGGTLQRVIDTELSAMHLTTRLTLVFALVAVIMCAVGVYSLTVSQVLQRQREFGIRMALGIAPGPLWVRFARSHFVTVCAGVTVGLAAAVVVMRLLTSLLYGIDAHDTVTFGLAALVILLVSALACVPSLFRLQRINPADCLRSL